MRPEDSKYLGYGIQPQGTTNYSDDKKWLGYAQGGYPDPEMLQPTPGATPPTDDNNDWWTSTKKGLVGVPQMAVGALNIAQRVGPGAYIYEALYGPADSVGKVIQENVVDLDAIQNDLSAQYTPEMQRKFQEFSDADGMLSKIGYLLKNPSVAMHTAVESAPSMVVSALGGGGLVKLAGGVVTTGTKLLAGALAEGMVTSGQMAEQMRLSNADGNLTSQQAGYALIGGATTALITSLSGKLGQRLGLEDFDLLFMKKLPPNKQLPILSRIIGGAVTEGLVEELPQSVQEQIWTNLGTDRPWDEGLADAAVLGAATGGIMGGGVNMLFGGRRASSPDTDTDTEGGGNLPKISTGQDLDPLKMAEQFKDADVDALKKKLKEKGIIKQEDPTTPDDTVGEPPVSDEPPVPPITPDNVENVIKETAANYTPEELAVIMKDRKFKPLREIDADRRITLVSKAKHTELTTEERKELALLDHIFQNADYATSVGKASIEFSPSVPSAMQGLLKSWINRYGVDGIWQIGLYGDYDWLKGAEGSELAGVTDSNKAGLDERGGFGVSTTGAHNNVTRIVMDIDRLNEFSAGPGLNPTQVMIEFLAEEFGHSLHKMKWTQLNTLATNGHIKAQEILKQFREEFTKYKDNIISGTIDDALSKFYLPETRKGMRRGFSGEILGGPFIDFTPRSREYILDETEFMGGNIAKYLTSNPKATNALQKWYRSVAQLLKKFYGGVVKEYDLPVKSVTRFLEFYTRKEKEAKAKKDVAVNIKKALAVWNMRNGDILGYMDPDTFKYVPNYKKFSSRDPKTPIRPGITRIYAYQTKDGSGIEYARTMQDAIDRGNGSVKEGTFDKNGNFQERTPGVLTPEELELLQTLPSVIDELETSFAQGISADPVKPKKKVLTPEEKAIRAQARQHAKQMWNVAVVKGKELGITPEEYLTRQGLDEATIKTFKKVANPPKSHFSDKNKAHLLARELGWIVGKDQTKFDVFKEALVGVRSMVDMSIEEQAKVRLALENIYYQTRKEKIDYRTTQQAQKEINKGTQVAFDDPQRSDFGELMWKVLADGQSYVGQTPAGAELIKALKHLRTHADNIQGHLTTNFVDSIKGFSFEQEQAVLEHYLGEKISEAPKIINAANVMKEIFNQFGMRSEELGIQITHFDGKKTPFVFNPDVPYFPQMFDGESLADKRSNKRRQAVMHMVEKGHAKTRSEAEVILDKYLAQRKNIRFGNLEYARDFDIPGWNRDIRDVVPYYIQRATVRLLAIELFGQDMKGLNELLGRIRQERGDEGEYSAKYAESVAKRVMGWHHFVSLRERNIINAVTTFEVWKSLGLFAITNATQGVNTFMVANLRSFAKGMFQLLTHPKASADFSHRIGASLHLFLNEYSEFQKGNVISNTLLNVGDRLNSPLFKKVGHKLGRTSSAGLFLKAVGGTHVEIFNRVLTSVVGKEYVTDLAAELTNSKYGSRAYKAAERRLRFLELDPDAIRTNGLTQFDIEAGALNLVRNTQFVNDAFTLPRWAGDNPWLGLLILFQKFGYQQTKLMYQMIKSDPIGLAKGAIAMGAVGFIANSAQRLLRGQEEDREEYEIALDALTSAGGFGILFSSVQNILRDDPVYRMIGGIVITDANRYASNVVRGLMKGFKKGEWDFEATRKDAVRAIPIAGPYLRNQME